MSTIVNYIRKNRTLTFLARCIQKGFTKEFQNVVMGYYERIPEETTILVEHPGERERYKVIYNIEFQTDESSIGLMGMLLLSLYALEYADIFHMIPIVYIGEKSFYYDKKWDYKTKNVFEYYFNPVSDVSHEEINCFYNVVKHIPSHKYSITRKENNYLITDEEIEKLASIYKKYISLNPETKAYLDNELSKIFDNNSDKKKVLGVHVRGGDYNLKFVNHPKVVKVEEYVTRAKAIFENGHYDRVFLATDDIIALNCFKDAFGDALLFFDDTFRVDSPEGVLAASKRQYGNYDEKSSSHCTNPHRLGLEVLRDVFALAWSDGLLMGLSNVSFAVRYIGKAYSRMFDTIEILDNGFNNKNGKLAKKMNRFHRI